MKMLISMVLTVGVMLFAARFMMGNMGDLSSFTGGGSEPEGLGELEAPTVDEDVTVYKWVDSDGVTHFGSAPPTNQGSYEKQDILTSTNVVEATRPIVEEEDNPLRPKIARVGELYSPEGIKDLVDDTKNLKDQMNEQAAERDKLLQELLGTPSK